MSKNSIISILLNNENVNFYTKLLIFLYYKNKNKSYKISDSEICKRLKLDIVKDRKKIYTTLCKIEKDKIIKLKIVGRQRFFEWLILEKEENDFELFRILENYNWLTQ